MDKKSCGAILYSTNLNGELGIILGDESRGDVNGWLPFKGGCKENETVEQAAIRELYEETCGLVKRDSIDLQNKFRTKRKEYHIGLCEVPYSIIIDFDIARKEETREEFMEKKRLKFFKFPDVLDDPLVHNISKSSILFYKDFLESLVSRNSKPTTCKLTPRSRYLGISNVQASLIRNTPIKESPKDISTMLDRLSLLDKSPKGKSKNKLSGRPKRFSLSHTPRVERVLEQTRVWRNMDISNLEPVSSS